jgi:hypothetical protein
MLVGIQLAHLLLYVMCADAEEPIEWAACRGMCCWVLESSESSCVLWGAVRVAAEV